MVLEYIIALDQAMFVRGRQIFVVVLVANEVVEGYKRANKAALVFKTNFEKAYDHVDQDFLLEVCGELEDLDERLFEFHELVTHY